MVCPEFNSSKRSPSWSALGGCESPRVDPARSGSPAAVTASLSNEHSNVSTLARALMQVPTAVTSAETSVAHDHRAVDRISCCAWVVSRVSRYHAVIHRESGMPFREGVSRVFPRARRSRERTAMSERGARGRFLGEIVPVGFVIRIEGLTRIGVSENG